QRPRRERAAAEAEDIDLVVRLPVPAQEAVELAHVRGNTDAGRAVERGKRRPARSADTLDVVGDLIRLGAVERLVEPPDVGLLLGEGVSRSVREQDVFSRRPPGSDGLRAPPAHVIAMHSLVLRRLHIAHCQSPNWQLASLADPGEATCEANYAHKLAEVAI